MADKIYKLYRITCLVSGKCYVGITGDSLAKRWAKHVYEARKKDYLFGRAILKYGKKNFTIEQIASAKGPFSAFEAEKLLIVQERTRTPFGYNSNDGGVGSINPDESVRQKLRSFRHSPETLAKMRLAQNNRSPEWVANMVAAMKGVPKSESSRALYSQLTKARMTDEMRARISAALTGREVSPERKAANSIRMKQWWAARKLAKESGGDRIA